MGNISEALHLVCIMDLENRQKAYARCLQTIMDLEHLSTNKRLTQHNEWRPFYAIKMHKKGEINSPKMIEDIERWIGRGLRRISHLDDLQRITHIDTGSGIDFQYYFKIALGREESDIIELQYFILLLQSLPSLQNRVAVRFCDRDGKWSSEDYFRVSNYLCFVQEQYPVFYASFQEGGLVQRLTERRGGTQKTFMPLLEIDWSTLNKLSRPWTLKKAYTNQEFTKLHTAILVEGCTDPAFTENLYQIGLRMLFGSLNGKVFRTAKKKNELLDFLCDLTKQNHGITALDVVLMGALGGDWLQGFDKEKAAAFYGTIQELSGALRQILENIVNHSEHAKGTFSLRIQRNRLYLKNNYPNYMSNVKQNCVELLIADSNGKDNIVTNFLLGNKADAALKAHAESISLSNFFGVFENNDIKQIWQEARQKRPTTCYGLLTFSNTINQMNGAFKARSSTHFSNGEERDYFSNTESVTDLVEKDVTMYLPGTQFSVAIERPLKALAYDRKQEENRFAFENVIYSTTYHELAQLLSYDDPERIEIPDELLNVTVNSGNDQKTKDTAAEKWLAWFNGIYTSKHIKENVGTHELDGKTIYRFYSCDMSKLCEKSEGNLRLAEPFCKGLLASKFFSNDRDSVGENVKHGIILHDVTEALAVMMNGVLGSLKDEINTSNTEVYLYPIRYGKSGLPYSAMTLSELLRRCGRGQTVLSEVIHPIFPYALLLKGTEGKPQFEEDILALANHSITEGGKQGYKIENTHMRLGNKVHLDTFYEMALFFGNPNYAYYTAFLLLKDLLNNTSILSAEKILLYGYASYSGAVTWAMIQILNEYIKINKINRKPEIEFVIYQNDLKIDSDDTQVQMYFSRGDWAGAASWLGHDKQTTLVMIVPISSSLTTFDKMLTEFCRMLNLKEEDSSKNWKKKNLPFKEIINYTAFWVRDDYTKKNPPKAEKMGLDPNDPKVLEGMPTDEEEPFWSDVNIEDKVVVSKGTCGKIGYLLCVKSCWENPLCCEKCYPEDPLLEYPLVETDPTSTVPTQQLYTRKNASIPEQQNDQENDERLARLKGHILYGHISRENEHFQYYVKTREYFQQEKNAIIMWIRKLPRPKASQHGEKIINVLIVPQHTDNVEFSQFIYEYYFGAVAHFVSVNTEKEFRSNFLAENNGLFQYLLDEKENGEVRFYYVDTSIRNDGSFNRVVSLLSSCVGQIGLPGAFKFNKVFVLISRISDASKCSYVNIPKEDFHAYLQINISSLRTFGDSCVPCKHQQDARHFFENAATKKISAYWEEKVYNRRCIPFDVAEKKIEPELNDEGYCRMMCAHRLAHYIRPIQGDGDKDYFTALQGFFDELRAAVKNVRQNHAGIIEIEGNISKVYSYATPNELKMWLSAGLKIIARPFFSYDYKLRCATMDLFLILSEIYLSEQDKQTTLDDIKKRLDNSAKEYLLSGQTLEWMYEFCQNICEVEGADEFKQFVFFRDHIFKGLADIRSNYLFRVETLNKVGKKLSNAVKECNLSSKECTDFLDHYMRSILRITHGSGDETKSLWLEHLLQQGVECTRQNKDSIDIKEDGIDTLCLHVPKNVQDAFRRFYEVLLVENNRPLYQRVRRSIDFSEEDGDEIAGQTEYYERNADRFLKYEYAESNVREDHLRSLGKLYRFLTLPQTESGAEAKGSAQQPGKINEDYDSLRQCLRDFLPKDDKDQYEVLLFGKKDDEERTRLEIRLDLSEYYGISPKESELQSQDRIQRIEKRIKQASMLEEDGYGLLENSDGTYDIILIIDNNYDALKRKKAISSESAIQKISPIYVYLECALSRHRALLLVRSIMMFRRKLVSLVERDFNNNAVAGMIQQRQLTRILAQDKVGDHAESDFVDSVHKLLTAAKEENFGEEDWQEAITKDGTNNKHAYVIDNRSEEHALLYRGNGDDYTSSAREWFLMRAYINSRISRLFRTLARSETSDFTQKERNAYYAFRAKSNFMFPAINLSDVFFTPIQPGYTRKSYLYQILQTHCLIINGQPDYLGSDDKCNPKECETIPARMKNIKRALEDFECVSIEKDNGHYAYLSEYLAIILLDCLMSALKASKFWAKESWSADVFCNLKDRPAKEKCQVEIERSAGNDKWDYLVIRNAVYNREKGTSDSEKRFGMSLKAIADYIEGFWGYADKAMIDLPAFSTGKTEEGTRYETKMLILKGKSANKKSIEK